MFEKRIKIFIAILGSIFLICILRLAQMQTGDSAAVEQQIEQLKLQRGSRRQLKTVRGRILDRSGNILAADEPLFQLCIHYDLAVFADTRFDVFADEKTLREKREILDRVIHTCAQFADTDPAAIQEKIDRINDMIYNRRLFSAWRRRCRESAVLDQYESVISIPLSVAKADFEQHVADAAKRLALIEQIDLAEMNRYWPLVEFANEDQIFIAEKEFMGTDGVSILPRNKRVYPYGAVASQTIGWVGPATQPQDIALFKDDPYARYLEKELCGREDGVEYVCESMLRGRRGEHVFDIDDKLVSVKGTEFGEDVTLTIDVELQQRIEQYLQDPGYNPDFFDAPISVVLIDAVSCDILALVSLPDYDLNRVRYDYSELVQDPCRPLVNRTVNRLYPPGSVVKPLVLITGLEENKIDPNDVIECPARSAPEDWPNCWIWNQFKVGHSSSWANNARNAIKGSCNIYFSRLAYRIRPPIFQQWLKSFGYGQIWLEPPRTVVEEGIDRNFRQAKGVIRSANEKGTIEQWELRLFGIGQGNMRVNPLQVANAMAALARNGLLCPPKLFVEKQKDDSYDSVYLNLSARTLKTVRDGMHAVVSEPGGTAYKGAFEYSALGDHGVMVFGKTGSTQNPANAWFGGWAEDSQGRSIAIALVVEGGLHGSSDAAPFARDILQFCVDAGYLGR